MRIGLIDFDGLQVNLALMKLSTHFKSQGAQVFLNNFSRSQVDEVYVSVLFEKNKRKAAKLAEIYSGIPVHFGGPGWDIGVYLPDHIENLKPDYSLYSVQDVYSRLKGISSKESLMDKAQTIVDGGINFLYRGCIRDCLFCRVPKKEPGGMKKVNNLADIINPRSNVVTILDNSPLAAPDFLDTITEIRERKLVVDFCQGIDVRLVTPEIAEALRSIRHLRSVHYAWDLMPFEKMVLNGIATLSEFIPRSKQMCFMLVGFDTTWEEDNYRFRKLVSEGVDPYVMLMNRPDMPRKKSEKLKLDFGLLRLHHWKRWVNSRIYKVCPDFEDYTRWASDRNDYPEQQSFLLAA
jgi:hypothetical protein